MNRRGFVIAGLTTLLLPTVEALTTTEKAYSATPKPSSKKFVPLKPKTRITKQKMNYDESYKTAHLYQYGDPVFIHDLYPETGAVMQDFVYTSAGRYFISQAGTASAPTTPQEDTIITRFNPETRNSDSMRLVDAGHGIGFEIEYEGGQTWVYIAWRGSDDSYKLVRFPYKPGTYTYSQVPGKQKITIDWPETLIHVDWKNNWCVFKHYQDGNDIFQRRKLSEMKQGIDRIYGREIWVPIAGETLQGFTTINDTLYKYSGTACIQGVPQGDPIRIQSWDWNTGQKFVDKAYPNLHRYAYRIEPEGIAVIREPSGKASLMIGLTQDDGPNKENRHWRTYKFADIGL